MGFLMRQPLLAVRSGRQMSKADCVGSEAKDMGEHCSRCLIRYNSLCCHIMLLTCNTSTTAPLFCYELRLLVRFSVDKDCKNRTVRVSFHSKGYCDPKVKSGAFTRRCLRETTSLQAKISRACSLDDCMKSKRCFTE
jgi:hypothetical protein